LITLLIFTFASLGTFIFKGNFDKGPSPQPESEQRLDESRVATSTPKLVDEKVEEDRSEQPTAQEGTCTVTKNGVTTVVPESSVEINEKYLRVECNSQGSSSVKTDINIETNTD
jgi:hypothetical protein